MNVFFEKFGGKPEELKEWTRKLKAYNKRLEEVYLAMIAEIQGRSAGKAINAVFTKRIQELFPEDVCSISVRNSDYGNEKVVSVRVLENGMRYEYSMVNTLCTDVKFSRNKNGNEWYSNESNCFNERSVELITDFINQNRLIVARYEDAATNCTKHIEKTKKAILAFRKAMETINPIFSENNAILNMSFYRDFPSYDFSKYEDELKKKVELYKPEIAK